MKQILIILMTTSFLSIVASDDGSNRIFKLPSRKACALYIEQVKTCALLKKAHDMNGSSMSSKEKDLCELYAAWAAVCSDPGINALRKELKDNKLKAAAKK